MSQLVKTKRQANLKDFKRFGAFKGVVEQKNVVSTRSCVNWAFFGTRGPNLGTNSLNKLLFILNERCQNEKLFHKNTFI
jgi:hypothetical protein